MDGKKTVGCRVKPAAIVKLATVGKTARIRLVCIAVFMFVMPAVRLAIHAEPINPQSAAATRSAVLGASNTRILAWWRFEDGEPGHWLDARLGSNRAPFSVTIDSSGNGNSLRTFNTRPTLYPPDTSPEFSDDVAADQLQQQSNRRSIHLNGKQYLYTMSTTLDQPIQNKRPFTIEGMFKLAVLPGDYDGKTQVVVCKINSPATQPSTKLSTELTAQLTAPPPSQRTGVASSRPSTRASTQSVATQPSRTQTSATQASATRPSIAPVAATRASTTQATRPTTHPTTREAEEPVSTELLNDHPYQPLVCLVAGRNNEFARTNHFAVSLLDRNKQSHVLASRNTLYARQWYAFAVVSDGVKADLYLSDLKDGKYHLEASTNLATGLMPGTGIWSIGCGLIDDLQDNWYQGNIDEIRVTAGALDAKDFLATDAKQRQPVPALNKPGAVANSPEPIVKGLADPSVMKFNGTYYLYGTRDQGGFPVYTSSDLQYWHHGPIVFTKTRKMWGESRFWAPSVIPYKGKFYLFYSALGPLHDSGNRHSHRVCIAVSDNPLGPFEDYVSPLPLNGKAAIDPEAFVDRDGKAYLYFVSDCSENVISQIYAIRMNDDLTGTVGEPVLCTQPSQVWEGTLWNEAPAVFRTGDIYVLMYSAQWWHGADYGVGFATSRSPLGPWTKDPDNPILQHYRGLKGTGGCCAAPSLDDKGMLIFFHAQGPPESMRRDTYFDQLKTPPDSRLGVNVKVDPRLNP